MKKLTFLLTLVIFLGIGFTLPSHVNAQVASVSAGITPDSFFYVFDTAWEDIGTFFTFGKIQKANRFARLAEERLAEAEAMAEAGNAEALEIATERYSRFLDRTERHLEKFVNDPELESIAADAIGRHAVVLRRRRLHPRPAPVACARATPHQRPRRRGQRDMLRRPAREHNRPDAVGISTAAVNVMAGGIGGGMQPVIGWVLDLYWDGRMEGGARLYSVE